jgi:Leucine-rich repeat (LRR) protein
LFYDLNSFFHSDNKQQIFFLQITNIQGLESLLNLQTLDLSHNKISAISSLSVLISLKTVDFRANRIANLTDLKDFEPLIALRALHLQGCEGEV